MAGRVVTKDPKKKALTSQLFSAQNSPEYSQQSQSQGSTKAKKFSLSGILGLNQSVELNSNHEATNTFSSEFYQPSHLEKETILLQSQQNEELRKTIKQLLLQIKKLSKSTKKIKKEVVDASIQPIAEASEYQVNFLSRLVKYIKNLTKNADQVKDWLQNFNTRSKQKGKFWNRVKKGGQQYMFSGEHSVSRSAG